MKNLYQPFSVFIIGISIILFIFSDCKKSDLNPEEENDDPEELPEELPPLEDNFILVFSESFDHATDPQAWPYRSMGWWNTTNNTLVADVPGHGNVLNLNFPAGTVGSQSGIGNYKIPLDSAYKELYFSWDYYIPNGFDWGDSDGIYGGKFFGGLAGGKMPNIPHDANDLTDGWATMNMFENGFCQTYNYFKSTEYSGGLWPNGDYLTTTPLGVWKTLTIRVKVNDPNESNGIFEVFEDSKLIYSRTGVQVTNSAHPDWLIESLYLNCFWGGSGECPQDQSMQFDNLVAFYYPPGSAGYRSGASEANRQITIPTAGSYHPVPPNKFTGTTYTEASGAIESHCGFYQPVIHPEDFETSTIEVSGASSITINVTKFAYDPGITYSGWKQNLKIYRGTGVGKALQRTFVNGTYTTVPTTVTITGSSATIEWQAGSGNFNGFSLNYTSNGSGSGNNFECGNYLAN
jgi:hypothetical protein